MREREQVNQLKRYNENWKSIHAEYRGKATKTLIQNCFEVEKRVCVWMQSSSLRDWHALRDALESINTETETHRLQIFHPAARRRV